MQKPELQKKRWQSTPERNDDRINRLKTPQECEIFSRNVTERGFPELAARARRRAVQLQAAAHDVESEAERDGLQAVYAYEQALSRARRKRTRATGAWRMIKRRGIIEAIQSLTNRQAGETDYANLRETGLQDLSFESIVVKHASAFDADTVRRCEDRLAAWARV
jgi:hypothetical protein